MVEAALQGNRSGLVLDPDSLGEMWQAVGAGRHAGRHPGPIVRRIDGGDVSMLIRRLAHPGRISIMIRLPARMRGARIFESHGACASLSAFARAIPALIFS